MQRARSLRGPRWDRPLLQRLLAAPKPILKVGRNRADKGPMARSSSVRIGPAFDSVLAAAQGDAPWAYERLWRAYAAPIASYLRLQGAFDPEDLTSEVFLGAFRDLAGFHGTEDQFRGYLFTIAHRRLT